MRVKSNLQKKIFILGLIFGFISCSCPLIYADNLTDEQNDLSKTVFEYNTDGYNDYLNKKGNYIACKETVDINLAGVKVSDDADISYDTDDEENVLIWKNGKGKISFEFFVKTSGMYNIGLSYMIPNDNDNNIDFSLQIDGKTDFKEESRFSLSRLWKDNGEKRIDRRGDELAPEQIQVEEWQNIRLSDSSGLYNDSFLFAFDEGLHTISFVADASCFKIRSLSLLPPEDINSYDEYLKSISADRLYDGNQITIQGEDATLKSENYLISKADRSSCDVYPNSPVSAKINYIGGNNWSSPGNTICWDFTVPSDGCYKIAFKYQQSYLMNSSVYRTLSIDGKVPFKEAAEVSFPYSNSWQTKNFESDSSKPYLIYLTKGKHSISLKVTLGEMSDFSIKLQEIVSKLGDLYREVTLITGDNPDNNRDYDLFKQIPNFEERLTECYNELEQLAEESENIFGKKGGTNASVLRNMTSVIKMMLKYRYQAQSYHSSFYDNYSSVSAWLYETTSMPLDIDEIYLAAPQKPLNTRKKSFGQKMMFSFLRLCSSFAVDYNSFTSENGYENEITLWVNWGRDQVQVLEHLIQSDFSYKNDIGVNVKLTNASLVQAILSGNGPDCYLHMARTQPINLAMRGALVDLSEFNDFEEICKRFMPSATIPYKYKNGVYALPDTQSFYMMFYREDILKQYNLNIPETWDEFINVSSVLMRNNLQIGLPYTQITNMELMNLGSGALSLYPTFLQQHDKTIYNDELNGVDLLSSESVEAFTMLTDFYSEYSFPKTFDFYNRFRTGLMPLGIQNYTMYTTLKSAATEIEGLWKMAPIPGIEKSGNINNSQIAGGTGAVIFKASDNRETAWEFLKWWTSTDIQYQYSKNIESLLGLIARNQTANVEAASKLSWENSAWEMINEQWNSVEEWPEIPGGYYIPRAIDQAFWNVINGNKTPREMLIKWNNAVNLEIEEKVSQYEN